MENVSGLTSKKEDLINPGASNFFNLPLSDFEIIKLQNLFINPVIHHISTKNVLTGRELINYFLSVFKHYQNIGCLTAHQNSELPYNIFDFFQLQNQQLALIDAIEVFCIENPYLDFVWIELTDALKTQFTQNQIKKICELFSSNYQNPVVVIEYIDFSQVM